MDAPLGLKEEWIRRCIGCAPPQVVPHRCRHGVCRCPIPGCDNPPEPPPISWEVLERLLGDWEWQAEDS